MRIRNDLAAIPGYKPGRTAADVGLRDGKPPIKLSSNESPFGPLPGVAEAIAAAASNVHRYPDMFSTALRQRIAERHQVPLEHISTGCGSDALCEALAMICAAPGDEIIFGWRSFEAYPLMTTRIGAREIRVPNTPGGRFDLNGIANAITDRTRLIFLCTPNNPTGAAITRSELRHFLDNIPGDIVVAIDEAYWEYVTDSDIGSGLELADRENVAVLRTFSKAWGLAGIRCGYLVAHPVLSDPVRAVSTPFSTSMPAQAGALAALDQETEMQNRVALTVTERERLTKELRGLNIAVPTSHGNFVWLPLVEASQQFAATCESRGVIVRCFPNEGIRVTIGTQEENDLFLAAANIAISH